MKKILLSLLLISAHFQSEAAEWKVTPSDSCHENISVTGKEGEPYLTVKKGTEEIKLLGKNGSVFHEESLHQTEFISSSEKVTYTVILPGYVEGNPAKIDIDLGLNTKRCRLELSR
jgi:hypothetical protein